MKKQVVFFIFALASFTIISAMEPTQKQQEQSVIIPNKQKKNRFADKAHTLLLLNSFLVPITSRVVTRDQLTKLDLSNSSISDLRQAINDTYTTKQASLKTFPGPESVSYFVTNKKMKKICILLKLNLNCNELSKLPRAIGQLTTLTSLDVCCNQLSSLPKSIGNLVNLKSLDVSNNKLKTIPDSIGNLTNLEELRLHNNAPLKTVPSSFEKLTALKILSLDINFPGQIPDKFKEITLHHRNNSEEKKAIVQDTMYLETRP